MARRDPFARSFSGVGYMGEGSFSWSGEHARVYNRWWAMLQRCYTPTTIRVAQTYANCSVEPVWHNYQNFASWLVEQPNHDSKEYQIDKDLIYPGNKIYGPQRCCVIPTALNGALKSASYRGSYGPGVKRVPSGRFEARTKRDGKYVYLGLANSPEEARGLWAENHSQYLLDLGSLLFSQEKVTHYQLERVRLHSDLVRRQEGPYNWESRLTHDTEEELREL